MCWLVFEGLGVEESSRTSRTTFEGLGLARYSDGRAGFGVETSHVTLHLLLSPTLKPLSPYAPKPLLPSACGPPGRTCTPREQSDCAVAVFRVPSGQLRTR